MTKQISRYPGCKQALQSVIDEKLKHGDIITKAWFCEKAGINSDNPLEFLSSFYGEKGFIGLLKNELGFVLKSLRNGSWLILPPKDGVDYTSANTTSKIRKSCKTGIDDLSCYDDNELDDQRIIKKRNKMASFSRILEFSRKRTVLTFEEIVEKNKKKKEEPPMPGSLLLHG